MNQPRILNIIVAAGSGSRFGADRPKQFLELTPGKSVLAHAVERMAAATRAEATVVVLAAEWMDAAPAGCLAVTGGDTRWQSVKNAIDATAGLDVDIITVHDGARPLPPADMIRRVTAACATRQGAIPVVPVTDSLRHVDGSAVDRAQFRAVQTPQAFRADLLRRAYALPWQSSFTDDASVMSAAGFTDIAMVEGHPANIKITLPLDLRIAALHLEHRD